MSSSSVNIDTASNMNDTKILSTKQKKEQKKKKYIEKTKEEANTQNTKYMKYIEKTKEEARFLSFVCGLGEEDDTFRYYQRLRWKIDDLRELELLTKQQHASAVKKLKKLVLKDKTLIEMYMKAQKEDPEFEKNLDYDTFTYYFKDVIYAPFSWAKK